MKRRFYELQFVVLVGLAMVFVVWGCGGRSGGKGDFSIEFLKALGSYGARFQETNNLPKLEGRWFIYRDENGFWCNVYGVRYDDVEEWAMRVFGGCGTPDRGCQGQRYCLFRPSEVGVALLITDNTNRVDVNCVRPITNEMLFLKSFVRSLRYLKQKE